MIVHELLRKLVAGSATTNVEDFVAVRPLPVCNRQQARNIRFVVQ